MKGYGQAKGWVANCCRCYWNDQCCSGCEIEQEDCDDFTPLYEDGVDELDYIEREYLDDMRERIEDYDEYLREVGEWE